MMIDAAKTMSDKLNHQKSTGGIMGEKVKPKMTKIQYRQSLVISGGSVLTV